MIDPKLQAELRAKFNPDGSDLRKMQLRMLDMLKYIDKICRENDIKYWLSSGTCLGAVRHGGFIPWDDDVDIEMEKKDFKKLCEVLKENKEYILQDHSTDFEYLAPYAKLRDPNSYLKENHKHDIYYKYHGIYIDIFCIEPSNSQFLNRFSSFLQLFLYATTRIKVASLRKVAVRGLIFVLHKGLFPIISKMSSINNKKVFRHIPGSMFSKPRNEDDIKKVKYVNFEDTLLPVPIQADKYLRRIYGNFMELPSLDDTHSHITKIDYK